MLPVVYPKSGHRIEQHSLHRQVRLFGFLLLTPLSSSADFLSLLLCSFAARSTVFSFSTNNNKVKYRLPRRPDRDWSDGGERAAAAQQAPPQRQRGGGGRAGQPRNAHPLRCLESACAGARWGRTSVRTISSPSFRPSVLPREPKITVGRFALL